MTNRLLMIVERFPPDLGGVARSASRTAAAIRRLGWEVHVLAWTRTLEPGALNVVETEDGLIVHQVGLFSNWDFSMQHSYNLVEWLQERHQFSVVWGHYLYPAGYFAVQCARLFQIPSTVSARGNDVDRLMFPPGDFARLLWTVENANIVSCVSADLSRKIELLLSDKAALTVLPNVVDAEAFLPVEKEELSSLREDLGLMAEDVILGFCGELRHKKGLPFLLTALRDVIAVRPAKLLVIGEIRAREQAHLTTFAARYPECADAIRVTGHMDSIRDVGRHLQLCDVVLQPSVWDGMPNAVLEAMSCGSLVIASDAGGIPEAVTHGETGFLVPRVQLNHLGTAILEVLGLPEDEKDRIRNGAAADVRERFNAEAEATRLQQLLDQLTEPGLR